MSGGFCPGRFCAGGFCPGGFCPRGDFVQGDFVRGILSGGFVRGDFVLEPLRLDCSFFFYKKVCVYHDTHAYIHKGEILAGQVIFNWLSSWSRSLVLSHLLCT